MKSADYKEMTIKASQIKKGDIYPLGSKFYIADSDAYRHEGIWSFDIEGDYRYGIMSEDTDEQVKRPIK